jgi:hypothetical protein
MSGLVMSEKDFEAGVKKLARMFGWKYYHTWKSIHSPAGFPDCNLVKPPRIIYAELKSDKGQLTPEQKEWLALLGQCPGCEVYLWRPADIEEITKVLQAEARQ